MTITGVDLGYGDYSDSSQVILFSPTAACKISARVTPSYDLPAGIHEYTFIVKRQKLEPKPMLQTAGKLTAKDMKEEGKIPYQKYLVTLVKDRLYVAEMSLDKEFRACPGFKYTGKGVDHPSFVGGDAGQTRRMIFKPRYSGEYEAQAGTFDDLSKKPWLINSRSINQLRSKSIMMTPLSAKRVEWVLSC